MMPGVVSGERYILGTATTQTTLQVGVVSGYGLGGLAVAFLSVRIALRADTGTFGGPALLISLWVRSQPAAPNPTATPPSNFAPMALGSGTCAS